MVTFTEAISLEVVPALHSYVKAHAPAMSAAGSHRLVCLLLPRRARRWANGEANGAFKHGVTRLRL